MEVVSDDDPSLVYFLSLYTGVTFSAWEWILSGLMLKIIHFERD